MRLSVSSYKKRKMPHKTNESLGNFHINETNVKGILKATLK